MGGPKEAGWIRNRSRFEGTQRYRVGARTVQARLAAALLLSTVLKNSGNGVLNSHSYAYDLASRRTGLTNTFGDYRSYTYDKIGQLKTAFGKENGGTTDRLQEQFGY